MNNRVRTYSSSSMNTLGRYIILYRKRDVYGYGPEVSMYIYDKITDTLVYSVTNLETSYRIWSYNSELDSIILGDGLYTGGLGADGISTIPKVGDNLADLIYNEPNGTYWDNHSKNSITNIMISSGGEVTRIPSTVITGNGNFYSMIPVHSSASDSNGLYYVRVDANLNITKIITTGGVGFIFNNIIGIGEDCYYELNKDTLYVYKIDAETLDKSIVDSIPKLESTAWTAPEFEMIV